MGLNRLTRAPCGFAFVFFRSPREAQVAVKILSGAQCDGRVIRVDPDSGRDIDGDRKYGRGRIMQSFVSQMQPVCYYGRLFSFMYVCLFIG